MLPKKSPHNSPNLKKTPLQELNYSGGFLPSSSDIHSDYQLKHIINGQKTLRMKISPSFQCYGLPSLGSQHSQQFDNKLNINLDQLTRQIKLHRDAIDKANNLIQVLHQQNQQLFRKLNQTEKQLYQIKHIYEEKLQKANNLIQQLQGKCSRNQTAANSFVQYSKSSKTTPVRIYGRSEDGTNIYFSDVESSPLQEMSKIILLSNITRLQKQLNNLQDFAIKEAEQVINVVQQNKYMQAYIQDEVFDLGNSYIHSTGKFGEQSKETEENDKNMIYDQKKEMNNLLQEYRKQIEKWKTYGGYLERQLSRCIKFMEELNYQKNSKKKNKKSYTNQDLIKFIVKDICKLFKTNFQKSTEQIKQLHSILKDLFEQIKKNQWKFVNLDKVKLP